MEEKKDPNDILLSRTFTEILIEQYRAHTCLYSESTNLKREMAYRSIRKGLKRQGYDIEGKRCFQSLIFHIEYSSKL